MAYAALCSAYGCVPLDTRILEKGHDGQTDAGLGNGRSDGSAAASGHCTPGKFETTPFTPGGQGRSCLDPNSCPGIPNRERTSMNDIALATPAVGGKPYAISMGIEAEGKLQTLELWGANEECGGAEELLWWGPLSTGILCAEFTPSRTYSRIFYVLRNQSASGNSSVKTLAMTFCPSGTCPGGSDGHSSADGGELVAPEGPYSPNGGGSFPGLWHWDIGPDGHMQFVTTGAAEDGGTASVVGGVFRTSRADPFGDAWYCIGEGSTFSFVGAAHTFSFKNITRLGPCKDHPGSGISSFTLVGSYASVTSTFDQLTASSLFANPGACQSDECWFAFSSPGMSSPLQLFTHEDLGVPAGMAQLKATIDEASWLKVPTNGDPLSLWCATLGTLRYELLGSTEVELNSMSGPFACPGEPVTRSTFEGRFE